MPTSHPWRRFEDLSAYLHPADRDQVRAAFTSTRGIVGAHEIDFRITIGDEIGWFLLAGGVDETPIQPRKCVPVPLAHL